MIRLTNLEIDERIQIMYDFLVSVGFDKDKALDIIPRRILYLILSHGRDLFDDDKFNKIVDKYVELGMEKERSLLEIISDIPYFFSEDFSEDVELK